MVYIHIYDVYDSFSWQQYNKGSCDTFAAFVYDKRYKTEFRFTILMVSKYL